MWFGIEQSVWCGVRWSCHHCRLFLWGWFRKCLGTAHSLLQSDKSHIFADQINLIDITQNDGTELFTFVFAQKMRINEFKMGTTLHRWLGPRPRRIFVCVLVFFYFGLMVAMFRVEQNAVRLPSAAERTAAATWFIFIWIPMLMPMPPSPPPNFNAPSSWHSNWNANSDECAHVARLGSVLLLLLILLLARFCSCLGGPSDWWTTPPSNDFLW